MKITDVDAWEVLDSRGDPTVRVRVSVESPNGAGGTGTFTVPSGASTGRHEAVERRDGGDRYGGRGVNDAVENVNEDLAPVVSEMDPHRQCEIDRALVETDGTESLERFGANAILAVSGAVLRAGANVSDDPLFQRIRDLTVEEYVAEPIDPSLPTPTVNLLSGGEHAPGGLNIQDVLAVPLQFESFSAAIEAVWQVREAVANRIRASGDRPLVADEGGFAPPLDGPSAAFELVTDAILDAGFEPGRDIGLAMDVAATECHDGTYYHVGTKSLTSDQMITTVSEWVDAWPLVSIEDPLAQDDWDGWQQLVAAIGTETLVLGDDLLATSSDRIDTAIQRKAATAALIKPNQAGTITRTIEATGRALDAGLEPVISARSGETCDSTIADLAVGLGARQIKIGSLARSERLSKYNRLLGIARAKELPFAGSTPYPSTD
jgi:enolase